MALDDVSVEATCEDDDGNQNRDDDCWVHVLPLSGCPVVVHSLFRLPGEILDAHFAFAPNCLLGGYRFRPRVAALGDKTVEERLLLRIAIRGVLRMPLHPDDPRIA